MISIIIPTYNEQENIAGLIGYLMKNSKEMIREIIVADGGSEDGTVEFATKAGAITVLSPAKSRAVQMNCGASIATGDILYFVHADTLPPSSFVKDIEKAVLDGFELGRYRTKFDGKSILLKLNALFTRFDFFICYGGDQTLFITKNLFTSIGGFKTEMCIMEEFEIVERARKKARYKIFQKAALISARKYSTNNWLSVQLANYKIVKMYKRGSCQDQMVKKYNELLKPWNISLNKIR
jgi:rSAM/selenodomain-associated transferase 2